MIEGELATDASDDLKCLVFDIIDRRVDAIAESDGVVHAVVDDCGDLER